MIARRRTGVEHHRLSAASVSLIPGQEQVRPMGQTQPTHVAAVRGTQVESGGRHIELCAACYKLMCTSTRVYTGAAKPARPPVLRLLPQWPQIAQLCLHILKRRRDPASSAGRFTSPARVASSITGQSPSNAHFPPLFHLFIFSPAIPDARLRATARWTDFQRGGPGKHSRSTISGAQRRVFLALSLQRSAQ